MVWIIAEWVRLGFNCDVDTSGALINMYGKCGYRHAKSGSLEDAWKAFSRMIFRNIVTWNNMISGFSHHGLGKEAHK